MPKAKSVWPVMIEDISPTFPPICLAKMYDEAAVGMAAKSATTMVFISFNPNKYEK